MNTIFSEAFTQALGWTLLHSLWQAALVAILFYGVRLARLSPQRTYGWAVGAMMSIVLAAVITFSLQYQPPAVTLSARPDTILYTSPDLPSAEAAPFVSHRTQSVMQWVDERTEWIVGLWLVGLLLFSTRFFGSWWYLQRLKQRGTQLLSPWQSRVNVLAQRLSIRRAVAFRVSTRAAMPMVIGQWKPMILMPLSMMSHLPSEQIEAIIVHELAHVRRQDYLINLLQSLVEVLFFYHPAVWWLSSVVREEREKCCDDLAVTACGSSLVYAKALLYAQEETYQRVPYAMAFANRKQYLLHRIQRLLTPQRVQYHWSAKLLGLLVPLALLVCIMVHRSLARPSEASNTLTAALLPGLDNMMSAADTVPADTAADAWRATSRVKQFIDSSSTGKTIYVDVSPTLDTVPKADKQNGNFSMSFDIDDEDSASHFYFRLSDDSVFSMGMGVPNPPNPPQGFSFNVNDSVPSFHFHWDGSTEEDVAEWSEELADQLSDLNFDFSFDDSDSVGGEALAEAQRELQAAQRELADAQRQLAAQQRLLVQKRRRLQQRRAQEQSEEEQRSLKEIEAALQEMLENSPKQAQEQPTKIFKERQAAAEEMREKVQQLLEEARQAPNQTDPELDQLREEFEQMVEQQKRETNHRAADQTRQQARAQAEAMREVRERESHTRRDRSDRAMEQLERALLSDGLIKNAEKYRFKISPSGLQVNGKKQSDELYQKYQSLLSGRNGMGYRKDGSLSIKKSPGSLSVQQEN